MKFQMIYQKPKWYKCPNCGTRLEFKKVESYEDEVLACDCGFFGWWIKGEVVERVVKLHKEIIDPLENMPVFAQKRAVEALSRPEPPPARTRPKKTRHRGKITISILQKRVRELNKRIRKIRSERKRRKR